MKNFAKLIGIIALIAVIGLSVAACDNDDNGSTLKDLRYSIQVNNQAAARTIVATDIVELYIENFEYLADANAQSLIIIAKGDRDQGSKGGILNNAGWYSVTADLDVHNDVNEGSYSGFQINITKLKVNGSEFDFPGIARQGSNSLPNSAVFGNPTSIWWDGHSDYPDNFNGITIGNSAVSLKTVLTVEPDIIDAAGNLATDPYQYIKVEGRINE